MKRLFFVTVLASTIGFGGYAFADGAKTFNGKCASCHGKDGLGKTGMGEKLKVPDLTKSTMADADVLKLVTDGKGKSPAFKGKLKDDEIKEVADFVKGLRK